MATATERTLMNALAAAEGIRQAAKNAALSTYAAAGFTPGALATYNTALAAADNTYVTSAQSAINTAGAETTVGLVNPAGGVSLATIFANPGAAQQ